MQTITRTLRGIDMISLDTTRHCNARCLFCFNDWASFRPYRMDAEAFKKVLPLLPMLSDEGQFLVGCWFEPTINPDFYKILKMLPEESRNKTYYTTNLAVPLTDEQIDIMCTSNVHHINISLESYNQEIYQKITKVTNGNFYENLRRLSAAAKRNNMELRLISMMLKCNKKEFPDLIRRAHEEVCPSEHEIRTPFFYEEDTDNKQEIFDELLTRAEIDDVREKVEAFGYTNLSWHTGTSKEDFVRYEEDHRFYEEKKPGITYWVRINADGVGRVGDPKEGTAFNLQTLEDAEAFFRTELLKLEKEDAKREEVPAQDLKFKHALSSFPASVDSIKLYDGRFLEVSGWETGALDSFVSGGERVAVLETDDRRQVVRMRSVDRPDVARALNNTRYTSSGFKLLFDCLADPGDEFRVYDAWLKGRTVYLLGVLYGDTPRKRGLLGKLFG